MYAVCIKAFTVKVLINLSDRIYKRLVCFCRLLIYDLVKDHIAVCIISLCLCKCSTLFIHTADRE